MPEDSDKAPTKLELKPLVITFVCPTLFGKAMILYFGLNYSDHPGEGYGIGLAVSVIFTLFMLGRFVWKYRDYTE